MGAGSCRGGTAPSGLGHMLDLGKLGWGWGIRGRIPFPDLLGLLAHKARERLAEAQFGWGMANGQIPPLHSAPQLSSCSLAGSIALPAL